LLAGKWAWGAVVTTPALRLYSTASVTADVTGNEVNLFGNGRIDITGSDAQAKLKAKYKYPLTMAVGGVRNLTKGRLGITAQYFTGIDPYSIVTPQSGQFLRPSSVFPNETTDKYLQVKTAARPVLNAAIAFERDLSEKLVLTVSFRTDFSAYNDVMKNENGIKPYITTWDIFHLAGGCTWHTGRHDLSLGLNLAAGTDNDYQQSVNLDDPTESNFLLGKLEVANARYFSAALILGYTYLFKR
jgi:hypothetical protein